MRVSHAVTVYLAMNVPPVRVGAANVTVAEREPGVATTAVGESGTLATTPPASEEPCAFVVVTETVYACPGTRPVSVTGLWAAATIWVPDASVRSVSTTVNPVIGEPLSAGVGQETSAEVPLEVTVTGSAARGGPAGTMVLDWFDARLGPNALMATAVNAYSAPSTRPSMRSPFCARYCGVISTVRPPRVGSVRSSAVTAYPVIGDPRSPCGVRKICAPPPVINPKRAEAVTRGASGTTRTNTGAVATLAGPVPNALVAVTVNVYSSSGVSPETTIGETKPGVVIGARSSVRFVAVTAYLVIGEPFAFGELNCTDAVVPLGVATTLLGAPGTNPTIISRGSEAGLVRPDAFVAMTVTM